MTACACGRPVFARTLCQRHYNRARTAKLLDHYPDARKRQQPPTVVVRPADLRALLALLDRLYAPVPISPYDLGYLCGLLARLYDDEAP